MENPVIIKRIRDLWKHKRITADAISAFVVNGLLTQETADSIMSEATAT